MRKLTARDKLTKHFRVTCNARARYTEPQNGAIQWEALKGAKCALLVANHYMREAYR